MTTTAEATMVTNGKSGRVNAITGIRIDFVKMKLMNEAAADLDIELEGPLEARMDQLWGHFSETTTAENQSICAQCNGLSDSDLDNCPYCGHDETLDDDDVASMKAAKVATPPAAPKPTTTKTTKKEADMSPTPTAEKTTEKKNGKVHKAVVIDDTTKSTALRTERDLDAAVGEVHRLKTESAVGMWKLGQHLTDNIYNTQLWKLRSEGGKPRYKNADAFCAAELGMTPQNAYKLMSIAKEFSEAQVRTFGTKKLSLLLEAPKEEQPKIQKRMEDGELKTKRDVEREVRKANKEVEDKPRAPKEARDGSKRSSPKAGKANLAAKQITVAKILGNQTIRLYKKPASTKNFDEKGGTRAKKIGDSPFGFLDLTNEVRMFFTIVQNGAGELSLRTLTQRIDEK